MKILFSLLCSSIFMFNASSQQDTKLTTVLELWIKNPTTQLSESLKKIKENEIKTTNEARLICEALTKLKEKVAISFSQSTESDLYELVVLFQQVATEESAEYLNKNGIQLLADILKTIHQKKYKLETFSSPDMMILKMFSFYSNETGTQMLADHVSNNYRSDEYLWSVILGNLPEEEEKYNLVIKKLAGRIPGDFLGITYLDMCNSIAINKTAFVHPFNSQSGYQYLDSLIENATKEDQSYVVSATTAVPFINPSFQENLLKKIIKYDDVKIQLEAAWAGAKLGKKDYADKLANFAKDYRYSKQATDYLEELGLNNMIPIEAKDPEFNALSEMCEWLAHPNEYGSYPDKAEIYDKRELYWPPTKDKRILYLIKYVYKNYNDDKTDEIGVGMVGSVTFSLFLDNINKLKSSEIYAIHCNWEMEKDNYQDIKAGIALIKKYNKDFK